MVDYKGTTAHATHEQSFIRTTQMSTWVIELLALLLATVPIFRRHSFTDPVTFIGLKPIPVAFRLYWNKTASSLNEFGSYSVNRIGSGHFDE